MRLSVIFSFIFLLPFRALPQYEHSVQLAFLNDGAFLRPLSEAQFVNEKDNYMICFNDDKIVWDNRDHCAFTCLTEWNKGILLAFREGPSHRPVSVNDYGNISILKLNGGTWSKVVSLSHPDMDLRDPFFVQTDSHLRLYCGYNKIINGVYQHCGSVYSDLLDSGWSKFMTVKHDVPHVSWLWKIREYNNVFYSVGYLEGKRPVLLSSFDGIHWTTRTVFMLEGLLSEADLCFKADTMFVCIRQDRPPGSPSYWGWSKYPFVDFKWNKMDVSIASPDLYSPENCDQFFLAGREYAYNREHLDDSIKVSLFEVDTCGRVSRLYSVSHIRLGDKGYPSLLIGNNSLFMSYYEGSTSMSNVRIASFCIRKNGDKE